MGSKPTSPIPPPSGPPVDPFPPKNPPPQPAVVREGKYALVRPEGDYKFWVINDMDAMDNALLIKSSFPCAEEIARLAFSKVNKGE